MGIMCFPSLSWEELTATKKGSTVLMMLFSSRLNPMGEMLTLLPELKLYVIVTFQIQFRTLTNTLVFLNIIKCNKEFIELNNSKKVPDEYIGKTLNSCKVLLQTLNLLFLDACSSL